MNILRRKPPYKLKFAKHWSRGRDPLGWGMKRVTYGSSFSNFSPFSSYLDHQILLLKTVYGGQKLIPRKVSSQLGPRSHRISSCKAPEQVNKMGPRPLTILLPRCHLVVISSKWVTRKRIAICQRKCLSEESTQTSWFCNLHLYVNYSCLPGLDVVIWSQPTLQDGRGNGI